MARQPFQQTDLCDADRAGQSDGIPKTPVLMTPHRSAPGRKKDLWKRLKGILVGRLKDRYGLSESQAEKRAEMWLQVSPDQWLNLSSEAFSEKRKSAKVVAIR